MKKLSIILFVIFSINVFGQSGQSQVKTLQGNFISTAEIEKSVNEIMQKGKVTGLSMVILNDGKIVYTQAFGYKNKAKEEKFTPETVTTAASFSKTVFAFLIMKLMEEGVLDLDKPLQSYFNTPLEETDTYKDLKGDDRLKKITARMCLSHTTGFPNWRWFNADKKLNFKYSPGERFSYSGEGMQLLQATISEITGKNLEELAIEKVFIPLKMGNTSYVSNKKFKNNMATGHDEKENAIKMWSTDQPIAAGSMLTTASDYGKFLVAVQEKNILKEESWAEIFKPQIQITSKRMFGPKAKEDSDEFKDKKLAWGLGFGLFTSPEGNAFFHTGHDDGFENYTVTYPDKRISIVLMSNSQNFESVAAELTAKLIGDKYSPFDWLGYE